MGPGHPQRAARRPGASGRRTEKAFSGRAGPRGASARPPPPGAAPRSPCPRPQCLPALLSSRAACFPRIYLLLSWFLSGDYSKPHPQTTLATGTQQAQERTVSLSHQAQSARSPLPPHPSFLRAPCASCPHSATGPSPSSPGLTDAPAPHGLPALALVPSSPSSRPTVLPGGQPHQAGPPPTPWEARPLTVTLPRSSDRTHVCGQLPPVTPAGAIALSPASLPQASRQTPTRRRPGAPLLRVHLVAARSTPLLALFPAGFLLPTLPPALPWLLAPHRPLKLVFPWCPSLSLSHIDPLGVFWFFVWFWFFCVLFFPKNCHSIQLALIMPVDIKLYFPLVLDVQVVWVCILVPLSRQSPKSRIWGVGAAPVLPHVSPQNAQRVP